MPVVFNRGQQLGQNDLKIVARNVSNILVDPYEIVYDLYDNTSGVPILLPPADRTPVRVSVGVYYADTLIPPNANIGDYLIQWRLKETSTAPVSVVEQSYGVVGLDVKTTIEQMDDVRKDLVVKLRDLLRDNHPDRNYHFRPPTDQDVIRGQTERFGYIWEDRELLNYLELAADYVSVYPPRQAISLDTLTLDNIWKTLVIWQAAYYALTAISINWIEEEFGYSIQGISLDIEKASKYQSMADTIASQVQALMEKAKAGLHFTLGIQQQRFGIGAQGVLGPYTTAGTVNPRNWVGTSWGRQGY